MDEHTDNGLIAASTPEARISIKSGALSFELSGPETFVTEHISLFQDTIIKALSDGSTGALPSMRAEAPEETSDLKAGPPPAPHEQPIEGPVYPKVIHYEGNNVSILMRPPGGSSAEKSLNLVLVYLWAKHAKGVDGVSSKELRDECERHGCLDAGNFAKAMLNARQFLIVQGVKGSSAKIYKITVPGLEKAKQLLSELDAK